MVSLEDAIRRAATHEWVVEVPMPVGLTIRWDEREGTPGTPVVTAIAPRGLPSLDQLSNPVCRVCRAVDFGAVCPGPSEPADFAPRCHVGLIGQKCFYHFYGKPACDGECDFPTREEFQGVQ